MTKAKNPKAEELIEALATYLRSLPSDARIDVGWTAGIERREDDYGMVEASHNGTRTITISVNGGAQNTEGLPKYLDRHPGLKAMYMRTGR